MDDLDSILDDVDIDTGVHSTATAASLDALLDDAMLELDLDIAPNATSGNDGNDASADDELELAIVSDYDKCLRLLGQKADTWRRWLVDDTPIKVTCS